MGVSAAQLKPAANINTALPNHVAIRLDFMMLPRLVMELASLMRVDELSATFTAWIDKHRIRRAGFFDHALVQKRHF